jgi:hypothetical protein
MRKVTWGMLGTATIAKRATIAGMKRRQTAVFMQWLGEILKK